MDSGDYYGYYGALANYPRGTSFDERTMKLNIPLYDGDVEEVFALPSGLRRGVLRWNVRHPVQQVRGKEGNACH